MTTTQGYFEKFENIRFCRQDGVLEMQLHTAGKSLRWNLKAHEEVEEAMLLIGRDQENEVIILTGVGDEFSGPEVTPDAGAAVHQLPADKWGKLGWEAKNLIMNMLAIEVPMIAAVNGPALRHAELPLMCDIVLASERAMFQDSAHFSGGLVPGDGVHVVFPLLMGLNRARYFLLTGQKVKAAEALGMGLVNEVHRDSDLLPRAHELARDMLTKPKLNRRYTRVLLVEDLRRRMSDLLGYGLALEGLAMQGHGV